MTSVYFLYAPADAAAAREAIRALTESGRLTLLRDGEGSALMKTPELAGKIIRAMVDSQSKPVTVKIRKGFDDRSVNAVEMALIAQENGASAVAVHGRTREQYYSGKADWDIIKKVKEALQRINDGTYGICEECGEEISINRLKARPVTRLCINCKAKQEQDESQRG